MNCCFNLVAQMVKNLPATQETQVEIGNGNPFQNSCLENSMDWGVWWAAVHGVTKSWIPLKQLSTQEGLHFLLALIRLPSTPPTVGSGPLHFLLFFPSSSSCSGVSLLIFSRSLQQALPLITPLKRHNPTQAESCALLYLFAVHFPTLEYKVQEIKNWDLLDSAPQCWNSAWNRTGI